jgi:low affinity Fe/Cu permease
VFDKLALLAAKAAGRPATFILAGALIVVWAVSGPIFGFSDTWQLVINTGTTIVTFLMVFLIQNTQNRDTDAMQIKLDELIRVTKEARPELLNLEELPAAELEDIKRGFLDLAKQHRASSGDDARVRPNQS